MENKQTAVEWLEDIIKGSIQDKLVIEVLTSIFNQAKAMEKEQIMDAYWEGGQDVPTISKQCEQYYSKTYGK